MVTFLEKSIFNQMNRAQQLKMMLWIYSYGSTYSADLYTLEGRTGNSDKPTSNDTNFPNLSSDRQTNLDMINTIKIM